MKNIVRLSLGIVLAMLIAGGIWWWTRQQAQAAHGLTGSGTIEATQVNIGPEVSGRIVQVMADEGQVVQAGDILFSLDDSMLSVQRAQAQAAIKTARAQRDRLLARARPEQLDAARATITTTQAMLSGAQENLAEALKRSAYDRRAASFYSWLGVTYYLTRDVVVATLRAIAEVAAAGSTIMFDYFDTDAFVPERAATRMQRMQAIVRQAGEPIQTGFDPSTLAGDLATLGLHLHEDLSPSDIERRYFQGRTDGYRAFEHVHFAWAVVA